MSLYPSKRSQPTCPPGITEFEILKASHKFLRDDDSNSSNILSWNDQLAVKYYDSLYREFAVCDLKHYKSGNFALRWRTENEVLSGAGETTCGNTRCEHHHTSEREAGPSLTTLELPFAYEEHGEAKSALVKIVLCSRCCKKLMWKRRKEQELAKQDDGEERSPKHATTSAAELGDERHGVTASEWEDDHRANRRHRDERSKKARTKDSHRSRKRNSRSKSPRARRSSHSPSTRRS